MATPHSSANAASKTSKGIAKLLSNYAKVEKEIATLKAAASLTINEKALQDLERSLAVYQRCIQKAEKAAEDHQWIRGAFKAFKAKARANKAGNDVEGTVKNVSKKHKEELKEYAEKVKNAHQAVVERISEAHETLRTSISVYTARPSNDTMPSIHPSAFSEITFETLYMPEEEEEEEE